MMMTKRFIAFAVALAAPVPVLAQEGIVAGPFLPGTGAYTTVPGGTFELDDNLANWQDSSGFSSILRSQTPALIGEYVGLMSGNPAPGFARNHFLYAPLVPGENYVLSGFFRAEEVGGSIGFDVLFSPGFTQIASQFLAVDSTNVGEWFFGYTTFTAPNQATYMRIVRNGGPFGSQNYFDDVAITLASGFRIPQPIPEPGVVGLCLLSGVLAGRRHRLSR
jgi:hypothetical protein